MLFLYALAMLARVKLARLSFYAGFVVGFAAYAPQLAFFWTIFGPPAVALWAILSFWTGLFVLLAFQARRQFAPALSVMVLPLLWMGIEYFRCELYYLRFAWLTPGLAFANGEGVSILSQVGVYGIGFLLMTMAAFLTLLPPRVAAALGLSLALAGGFRSVSSLPAVSPSHAATTVMVAGVQVEFPVELEVPLLLDKALAESPTAQLFLLSEYVFDGPIPRRVKDWCKRNRRYLIAGGKDVISGTEYYNTAFVVGPSGDVVFQQAKSIPIQFFRDGLPARELRPWDSPWGKLGICICYDLSYSRVTDALVRQGARALLVPTMDVADWGEHEHHLHARVAPVRAAEYGIPIFRVASVLSLKSVSFCCAQMICRRGVTKEHSCSAL
ncbi:MAG: nitrilase-related carbon-nitrogen hydrolase [Verrucomicrobiota bacterium]